MVTHFSTALAQRFALLGMRTPEVGLQQPQPGTVFVESRRLLNMAFERLRVRHRDNASSIRPGRVYLLRFF